MKRVVITGTSGLRPKKRPSRGGLQEKGGTREARRRYSRVGVGRGMDVLRAGGGRQLTSGSLGVLQEMQALGDNRVAWVELRSASICVDSIRDLVIAALVQATEVEPDLRDVRVDADRPRVRIQCVTELIDLEVENADGAPEGGISPVAVDGLLIRFVCLVVLLTCHVCTPEEIPALGIRRVYNGRVNKTSSKGKMATHLLRDSW